MALRNRNSYFGQNVGTLMCTQRNVTSGQRLDSFTVRLAGFPSGSHQGPWNGDQWTSGSPRKVKGGIWLSYPSDAYDEPDFISTNECDTSSSSIKQIPLYRDCATSEMTQVTFNFDNAVINQGTVYLGLYTAYPSVTKIAFAGDNSYTLINNMATPISTWANHGLYFDAINMSNPYTASSIWLNPDDYTKISKINSGSWSVHYSYNSGSNSNMPISLAIHDYSATSWGVRWEPILRYVTGSSDGVWDSYTLNTDKGFGDGSRYRITLVSNGGEALSPPSWDPRQGLTIYTYRIPVIDNSISINRSEQNANQDNKFSIFGVNNRAWSDFESEFQTWYKVKKGDDGWSGWNNLGNVSSLSKNASEMRSFVPKGYDGKTIQIQFERYSPSAPYESSNKPSGSFKVYYRPQIAITGSNASYKNSSGTAIAKSQIIAEDKLTDITVTWTYDTDQAKAGYTQGYRIRLYKNDGTIVKTYYTTSKNYPIPKNDIPKDGLLTYLDITPYFGNDQPNNASSSYANNYWYYNGTITKFNFVIVACRLNTPVITYPVNNSTWINDDFRICFQMPNDPNRSAVSGTYKYDNIEFEINNKVYKMRSTNGTTSGAIAISQNYTFSTLIDDLTYQKKIVIWPNANSITINNLYAIRVRVRRPYNATADTYWGWSEWSNKVTITKSVPSYSVVTDQIIMASHYNVVRNAVENAKNTYAISDNIPDKAVAKTTIIKQEQYYYNNIFKRIVDTKNRVNNYATITPGLEKVKFDYNNVIITSFSTSQEFVTAAKNGTGGKNYMQYIFDNVTALK